MTAYDPDAFLTGVELVERWRNVVTTATLANWRSQGRGPSFTRVGKRVMYRMSDVVAWEQSQQNQPRN